MSNIKTLEEISRTMDKDIGEFVNIDLRGKKPVVSEGKLRGIFPTKYFKSGGLLNSKLKQTSFNANHYGEYIAYIILSQLGIPVCKAELAKTTIIHPYSKKEKTFDGVLSYFEFKKNETAFFPIRVFIEDYINSGNDLNVELILKSLEYKLKKNGQETKIPEIRKSFFDMCAFDMIFANRDRHDDNFGLKINETTGEIEFYPLFDNEQILGMQEDQKDIIRYQSSEEEYNKFKETHLTSYIGVPDQSRQISFKTLLEYLLENYENEILESIENISRYTISDLEEVMSMCNGLSEVHKEFAKKIFTERTREINEIIENFKQRKESMHGFSQSD